MQSTAKWLALLMDNYKVIAIFLSHITTYSHDMYVLYVIYCLYFGLLD